MNFENIIPWKIRHFIDTWIEENIRPKPQYHRLYKFLKFGRTNINTPKYWDKEWAGDTIQRNYDTMFSLILERIPEKADVLDVGCGVGRLSKLIKKERNATLTCLDFSSWACEQLKQQGFNTVVSSLPKIPLPDNQFDIAVATEVFEHLDSPEKTLLQMARVIKPGGILMCSVPNDTLHPHVELEHQGIYTTDKLQAMLTKFGTVLALETGKLTNDSTHEFILGIVQIENKI